MQNPVRNWRLYQLAKTCNCRPSDLLGLTNSYQAFCLDEAVVYFGDALEAELERVSEKAKTQRAAEGRRKLVLEKWLQTPEDKAKTPQYATPVATK